MKKFDVVAFGEVLIDFTNMGSVDGQKLFAQNPGGAPANVLVACQKLGCKTAFLGKAGNDMHGKFLKETLEQENIDTKGFLLDDNYFTTLAFVDLDKNGERTFSFARKPGADTQMTSKEIALDILEQAKIFHVGSLSLTDEPSRQATFYAIEQAKKAGAIISYDPNYRASLWENKDKGQMLKIVPDIIKISDEEMSLFTNETNYKQCAKQLYQKGVKIVLITLASKGSYVLNHEGGMEIAGFNSEVIDTTGAGDAFLGGFLSKIAENKKNIQEISLEELATYAKFANAVASLCIEKNGAIKAMPTIKQVLDRNK